MAGWDSWVNCLLSKNHISTAGIFGLNGDKYYANFENDPSELKTIISCLSCGDSNPTSFNLLNRKFIKISDINGILVGKVDKNIAAIGLAKTTCVVGMYIDGADPKITTEPRVPDVLSDVAELVDYLLKSGC